MRFGVVPVPNLCVELRGYDPSAVEEAATTSTTAPTHPSNANGVATASGDSSRGWEEGKPRFRELQRSGESDGSFMFVAPEPESGMVLVLAAYPHGGEDPIVRMFRNDNYPRGKGPNFDQGTAGGPSGGEASASSTSASAFGIASGRVQMHIDLSEGTHAPEALWSASSEAGRGKDRSPCTRHEAAVEAGGSLGAATGVDENYATSAAEEQAASARQHGRWSPGEGLGRIYHGIGGGGATIDQAKAALTDFLRSSRRYVGELSSGLWKASAVVCAHGRSRLETAGKRVYQSALAASTSTSEWFGTVELSSRLALFSPITMLTSWHWQRSTSTEFSAWFGEASSALVASWLDELNAADARAWWASWWVKVGAIALILGLLQEVFAFVYKCFKSPAGVEVAMDDHQYSASPRQDQDSTGTSCTLVGTFHSSAGTVCQLDFGKLAHPQEPATFEKKRAGFLGAAWGRSSSGSSGSQLVDDVGAGGQRQAEPDEFSSMFRALSQTSGDVAGFKDEDEVGGGGGGGGAASNVVVVTQQMW